MFTDNGASQILSLTSRAALTGWAYAGWSVANTLTGTSTDGRHLALLLLLLNRYWHHLNRLLRLHALIDSYIALLL